jgi:hypothetical protein
LSLKNKDMALKLFQKNMQLQPVTVSQESDELIEAIQNDPLGDGDAWDLHQEIDPTRLNRFLDDALKDQTSNAKA